MTILHLEDDLNDAALIHEVLAQEFPECSIHRVDTRQDFLAGLEGPPRPDLIISDFTLPGFDGLSALNLARTLAAATPFVFLSGSIGEERALAAVREGAYDYVLKDNMARLPIAIRRALDETAQRRERRDNERRLRELAEIIERASEAIVVSDITGRITLWNDGAARLYGISAAQAMGRLSEEIFSQGELAVLLAARAATSNVGEWKREVNLQTPDGRQIVVEVRMTLVRDAEGNPKAHLSIANDITEKKRLEEQFLRAQRLESLGLLAAGIAHDFNNVLAPLTMAAPLLRMRATDPADRRILDIIETSSRRGAGLVRQILGFARGAGGTVQSVQIGRIIAEIEEVIRASFPKSIALKLDVPADLPAIQANPTQIHQILLNLSVNARDAMLPEGGTVSIRAAVETLDQAAALKVEGAIPGEFIVLEIADTGKGIAPEVLAQIWTPFFTTKGEGKGTGLGLSTVRGITSAHGGFATVESKLGQGTVFRAYLPIGSNEEKANRQPQQVEAPRGHGEMIMIVEDEAALREVAAAILSQHGYQVESCGDSRDAVKLFQTLGSKIRLVITDINMPFIDGVALARRLRGLRPDLKILAVSGLGSSNLQPGCAEAALFDQRLSKPFSAEMLQSAVYRHLQTP